MTITKTQNGTNLTLSLEGRLDTVTAPELEAEIEALPDGVESLTLDLKTLEYISSAGLRVLLRAQKAMSAKGGMKVTLREVSSMISRAAVCCSVSPLSTCPLQRETCPCCMISIR